ncbi:hypothetical protein [Streptomyces sp. NPDC048473]|uniref:hypothetical protein n=1 Tax=unclassified Streptomyces TaxID=2593676 RepID=UPI00371AA8FA
MGVKLILSRRMVLRPGTDEDSVDEFAARLGLLRHADIPENEEEGVPHQVVWHSESGPALNYREDMFSGLPYVVVTAEDPRELHEFVGMTETVLDTWRIPELWKAVDTNNDPDELPEAILRMGLGAPKEFNEEVFSRVCDALTSEREDVCEAALIATTYQPWGQYVNPIRDLLREGLSEPLEDTAQIILDEFGAIDS